MIRTFRRYLPYLAGAAVLGLFVLHTLRWLDLPLMDHLKRGYYDFRLRQTVPNRRDQRIVIVDIDEKSLAKQGRWPWPRDRLAHLVDILFDHYRIRLLGFDAVFAERDDRSGWPLMEHLAEGPLRRDRHFLETVESLRPALQFDAAFARALHGRPVVLGFLTRNDDGAPSAGVLPRPLLNGGEAPPVLGRLPSCGRFTGNLPELQTAAAAGGFFVNPFLDEDGVFRHLPLLLRCGAGVYESLALSMFRVLEGFPPVELEIGGEYGDTAETQRLEALWIGARRIPTGERAEVLIPYLGRQGSFIYLSIADVMQREIAPEALRGRIVLIGTSASGLMDARATPVQASYPGVEIHATVLAAMLDGTFRERPPWIAGLELLQLLAVGLAMILLSPRLPAGLGSLLALGLMAALLAGNFWLWTVAGLAVDAVLPLALLFFLYANQMFFGFFLEGRKQRVLTRLFGHYVPEELVREMSRRDEDFGVGGETREMTVLFSDVRGFTAMAEQLPPAELSRLMNEFLTPLTAVIHSHQGTIDKYMGDAIMAFWGAPLPDGRHAAHGVRAALEMVRRVEEIEAAFRARGWPEIRIGVGLNTGTMSVGNMGSEFRMAYTVLGDAVNLGSRLEGLTQRYGVSVLLSEFTRRAAEGPVCREIDRVRVKGKNEPVAIYEPLGWPEEVAPETLAVLHRHHEALSLYRARRWIEAGRLFGELAEADPERMIYRIYLERIALFRENPPPDGWDGVFAHASK